MTQIPLVQPLPPPWRVTANWPIGGLFAVGYAPGTDLLLVLSWQGRGLFDCLNGQMLARDPSDVLPHIDQTRLIAEGIGPLAGESIRVAGLFGGGLAKTTSDGWFLEVRAMAWPTHSVFMRSPDARSSDLCIGDDGACEMRACGFSETGRSFVIATTCELSVFTRPAGGGDDSAADGLKSRLQRAAAQAESGKLVDGEAAFRQIIERLDT